MNHEELELTEEEEETERNYWAGELGTEGECNLHNRLDCGYCN